MISALARRDKFPVNRGHLPVIPFRYTPDFFSMTAEERAAAGDLLREVMEIERGEGADASPGGYRPTASGAGPGGQRTRRRDDRCPSFFAIAGYLF